MSVEGQLSIAELYVSDEMFNRQLSRLRENMIAMLQRLVKSPHLAHPLIVGLPGKVPQVERALRDEQARVWKQTCQLYADQSTTARGLLYASWMAARPGLGVVMRRIGDYNYLVLTFNNTLLELDAAKRNGDRAAINMVVWRFIDPESAAA